jgi:hypothetical protein
MMEAARTSETSSLMMKAARTSETASPMMKAARTFETSSLLKKAPRTYETLVDNYFTRQYIPDENSEFLGVGLPGSDTAWICR